MTIYDRVVNRIREQLGTGSNEVKPEHKLGDDLGADSLDQVELVMALEEEFGVEIPDDDITGTFPMFEQATVAQVVAFIEKQIQPIKS